MAEEESKVAVDNSQALVLSDQPTKQTVQAAATNPFEANLR